MQDLLTSYKAMGRNMSLKIHFLESQLDFFQKILAKSVTNTVIDVTKKFGYEKAVPRQADLKYVGSLLLTLKRDVPEANYRRKSHASTF